VPERLKWDAEVVAAMVGFPLLEEVARRATQVWDGDGVLRIDVPESMGLFRINSKGKREAKTFKIGDRIVDLSRKLFCTQEHIASSTSTTIENLEARLCESLIEGLNLPHITLFKRLQFYWNQAITRTTLRRSRGLAEPSS
jgi:hypothetical protein